MFKKAKSHYWWLSLGRGLNPLMGVEGEAFSLPSPFTLNKKERFILCYTLILQQEIKIIS